MIQVQGLCKRFLDYQRGWKSAITDISFEVSARCDLRAARAQRRRQDHDAADLEHGPETDRGPGDRRGARRFDRSAGGAGEHRLHVGQHGHL